jgi:hypothetical protein
MQRAVEAFDNDFRRWHLHLPAEAIESRRAGQIRDAGWSIRYNFGRDARGDYLDYYASPRDVRDDPPGDDWHVRLYASGERATLPPVLEAYMYGRDPTWEELERSRRQYDAGAPEGQIDGLAPVEPAGDRRDANLAAETELTDSAPQVGGSALEAGAVEDVLRASPGAPSDPEIESIETDVVGDGAAPYLPLDIGLHVELELAQGSAGESAAPEPTANEASSPPADPPDDLFYAPDDLAQFLPAAPEEAEEEPVVQELRASPGASPHAGTDDTPAPITLDAPEQEADQRPGDIVSEEDEPLPETLSEAEAQSVESIGAVPLAEPDSLSHVPADVEAAEGTHASSLDGESTDENPQEGPSSPPLAGKAIPTKIFRRADLVLTADAARIDPHVDPGVFRPWWFRANARRAAIAIAAVALIAIIAVARARHRASADAQALGTDVDTSAANAPSTPAAAAAPVDSGGTSDSGTAASPDSQPAAQNADSATPVSAADQVPKPQPLPDLRPADDHSADEGMARPAGPRSLVPIAPSAKGATGTNGKYPSGSFPRGYSP